MENTKIILGNNLEANVNGIFYIFNSKYYFIYTQGEAVDDDYVQLYIVQVCKEVQNTPTGQDDTGNMLGVEIKDENEWSKVQASITEIVDDKKNGTVNKEIQYLPITMLTNLKIISKNKFKLMKHLVDENFKTQQENPTVVEIEPAPIEPVVDNPIPDSSESDIIIDYRTKFFEEQEKNKELQEQIKDLQDKINSIKQVIE